MELKKININELYSEISKHLLKCIYLILSNTFNQLEPEYKIFIDIKKEKYKKKGISLEDERELFCMELDCLYFEYLDSENDKFNNSSYHAYDFMISNIIWLQDYYNTLKMLNTFFDLLETEQKKIEYLINDLEVMISFLKEKRNKFNVSELQKYTLNRSTRSKKAVNSKDNRLSSNATAKFFIALERLNLFPNNQYMEKARAINMLTGYGVENMRTNLNNFELNRNDLVELENFTREILNEFKKFNISE